MIAVIAIDNLMKHPWGDNWIELKGYPTYNHSFHLYFINKSIHIFLKILLFAFVCLQYLEHIF